MKSNIDMPAANEIVGIVPLHMQRIGKDIPYRTGTGIEKDRIIKVKGQTIQTLFCDDCAGDEEEGYMPLVNSPRTGVCGYCG